MSAHLRRFDLLATAIAGFPVSVGEGTDVRVYSDGSTIYVPVDSADLTRTIVIQAALMSSGALDPKVLSRLVGRRKVRGRYLTLEVARAFGRSGALVPRDVAAAVAEVYCGPVAASPTDSLAMAIRVPEVPEAPDWYGAIKPSSVLLGHGNVTAPTEADRVGQSSRFDAHEMDDEDDSAPSRILEMWSAPALRNPLFSALQKLLGAGRTQSADASGDELPVGGTRVASTGTHGAVTNSSIDTANALVRRVGRLLPEWDTHHSRYRPDWVSVNELDPRVGQNTLPLLNVDLRLLKQLARLNTSTRRQRRQEKGDVLDPTALIDYAVDRRRGDTDDRVYESAIRASGGLGVLVLLDASGSTAESAEGRAIFEDQRLLTARLLECLEDLGERVAGHAFNAYGRHDVRFLHIKNFDDRFDAAARQRLWSLEPSGFTRFGAAVRYATHLLKTSAGSTHTLLVVIGDGLPYDEGYEAGYAQDDTRRALSDAVEAGVGCVCISVGTAVNSPALERVWGHVPNLALDDLSDLHSTLLEPLRLALRQADATSRAATPYARPA